MTSGVQRALSNGWLQTQGLLTLEAEMERACSETANRPVRTRMLRVVWEGSRVTGPPIPIGFWLFSCEY